MSAPDPGLTNAFDNPVAVNALAAALEGEGSGQKSEIPLIPPPATDGLVRLPGGLLTPTGELYLEAEVRELTGADEEAIFRARGSGKFSRFVSALLRSGVETIGGRKASEPLLKALLIGDRDALILGIRRATYGEVLDLKGVVCPHCDDVMDLTITLDDFPERKLDDPMQRTWEVELRKGGVATVRLPTGADQEAVYDDPKLTVSQQDTLLLSRCLVSITTPDGDLLPVTGVDPALKMGLVDRRKILELLASTQPGPRYEQLTHTCEACGKGFPLVVTVGDLFFG